jgi:DNA-binding beta-propeller fold protein YncE
VAVDARTGRAFVINGADYTVSVLDTASGDVVRSVPVSAGALMLAVDEPANDVFVLNGGGDSVDILSAASGVVLHTIALSLSPYIVAINQLTGRVYVANPAGTCLLILDGTTGTILHKVPLQSVPLVVDADGATGQVLLANNDGTLQLRNGETGSLQRTIRLAGYTSAMTLDERTNHAFVADPLGATVTEVDVRTGTVLRVTHVAKSPAAAIPMPGLGEIVVASLAGASNVTNPGELSILDTGSGRLLQAIPMSQGIQAILGDVARHAVFVDTGSSILEVDIVTGNVIQTLPVPGTRLTGQGMAIDEQTQHLFVVNTDNSNGSTVAPVLDWLHGVLSWLPIRGSAPYSSISEFGVG